MKYEILPLENGYNYCRFESEGVWAIKKNPLHFIDADQHSFSYIGINRLTFLCTAASPWPAG